MPYVTAPTEAVLSRFLSHRDRQAHDRGQQVLQHAVARLYAHPSTIALREVVVRGFRAFRYVNPVDGVLLRHAASQLYHLSRVRQANRNVIIRRLLTVLSEPTPYAVLRLDIQKFYDSVPGTSVIERLRTDLRIPRSTVRIATAMLESASAAGNHGLPKGICLSAQLAEDWLRPLDRDMREQTDVYYYARFVDDIVVVAPDQRTGQRLEERIAELLHKSGTLRLHPEKRSIVVAPKLQAPSGQFDFLGYRLRIEGAGKNRPREVTVDIAPSKVARIKRRLVLSALDFRRTGDFALLHQRIRALTGNYSLYRPSKGCRTRTGIYFNYPELTEAVVSKGKGELSRLDVFLRSLLTGTQTGISRFLRTTLTRDQKSQLLQQSFKNGWLRRIQHRFSPNTLSRITECWRDA